jgi:outer membrane protein OmpA-like peptidoglycan-associated protein
MRPLIIGIFVFLIWSSFSTWYYVCHINDFCNGPETSPPVSTEEAQTQTDSTMVADTAPEEEILAVPENLIIHFAFDRSDFKPSDLTARFVSECKEYLDEEPDAHLLVTGHTDAIGTDSYNQALGMRRAESVKIYLTGQGLPAELIETVSMGERAPVAENTSPEGRAENRRAETSINFQ